MSTPTPEGQSPDPNGSQQPYASPSTPGYAAPPQYGQSQQGSQPGYGQQQPQGYGNAPGYSQSSPSQGYAGQWQGQGHYTPGYGAQPAGAPENSLALSVAALILFLPLGIAALLYSLRVEDRVSAGDQAGARAAAEKAKMFGLWGTIVGGVLAVLLLILFVAVAVSDPYY